MNKSKIDYALPPFGLANKDERANKKEEMVDPLEELSDEEMEARFGVPKDMTTCYDCPSKETCRYAWDPYNTDGDCLASK